MAEETQFQANTGMQTISTANSNLDGTGTLSAAIITGASNGTLINTVTIKAQSNTSQGMVRLFIYDGTNTKLVAEIEIPAVTKSATDTSFELTMQTDFALKSGWSLKASTEVANTFNVIAEGLNWAYPIAVRPESSRFTANTGMATISTANSNLDGTGTLGTVLTAASFGTTIQSVTVKSQANTTAGMVRLFLYDGTNTKLLTEIQVDATTKSTTAHSFSRKIDFSGKGFALASGWLLKASTENAETFNIIAEGLNWTYPDPE
jgi:hypothetical protein